MGSGKITMEENEMGEEREGAANLVAVGSRVQVELVSKGGARETLEFDLVPDREADFSAGWMSAETPLARAILGQAEGAAVPYRTGDLVEVRILRVRASGRAAQARPEEAAAAREARMRQALDRADLNNAISFALTFESKWGGYDPEAIAANWEEKRAGEGRRGPRESEEEKGEEHGEGEG